MIADLRHSQNNGSTNSETNYHRSDISPFFCTVKLTLKVSFFPNFLSSTQYHYTWSLYSAMWVVQNTPHLSEINTFTKNTQNIFRQNQPDVSSVPTQTYGSWGRDHKKHMYNHRLNEMIEPLLWHVGWSDRKTHKQNQTKQWLYTFATYSQEPERSSSESREHISCSLCGSVRQKYKIGSDSTTNWVFPTSVIITTVIINNNNINIIKYWKLPGQSPWWNENYS